MELNRWAISRSKISLNYFMLDLGSLPQVRVETSIANFLGSGRAPVFPADTDNVYVCQCGEVVDHQPDISCGGSRESRVTWLLGALLRRRHLEPY